MTESSKKRKRTTKEVPSQTITKRGVINANWQKLLSSNLVMDTAAEKTVKENKEHFTGTFRRARKKKNKNITSNSSIDITSLNLNTGIENNIENVDTAASNTKKPEQRNKLTKFLAMDCEMVGIGYDGNDHMLARVSIVNKFGDCIYDKYVKAREEVKDYRTEISGIRREDMLNGEDFNVVQKEVSELLRGKILIGHSLNHDLSVLFLSHPKRSIRDTSRYKPFKKITKGSTPSLKRLSKEILGIDIQHGEHSSVEDARAAMKLYTTVAKKWEASLSDKRGYGKIKED